MKGEKIFEWDLNFTGTIDYGVTLGDILAGKAQTVTRGKSLLVERHIIGERFTQKRTSQLIFN